MLPLIEERAQPNDKDRAVWESHAVKVRAYIQESKAAFAKAIAEALVAVRGA